MSIVHYKQSKIQRTRNGETGVSTCKGVMTSDSQTAWFCLLCTVVASTFASSFASLASACGGKRQPMAQHLRVLNWANLFAWNFRTLQETDTCQAMRHETFSAAQPCMFKSMIRCAFHDIFPHESQPKKTVVHSINSNSSEYDLPKGKHCKAFRKAKKDHNVNSQSWIIWINQKGYNYATLSDIEKRLKLRS